ncbi:ABC transporter permease [Actinomadura macrotermitis]|uniref:Glutathione transport system permease protein GsiC n=1 Tax=Actinomadura macrotermitis TaxID=2585200 RepID=A0A7K0C8M1_9ACTN|nr:ABC transporter permease [Actinomadura macrotermitis]MQY09442.1 Glutathione transport system permease protein GsiC [Actinomadura macrotermitis]
MTARTLAAWIGKRALGAVLTVLAASILIYGALRLVPGDPVLALTAGRRLTPEQIEAVRHRYGLDQGFLQGYLGWIGDALRLDLGTSFNYQTGVTSLITGRLGVSGLLVAYSAVLAIGFGTAVALVSAVKGGLVDRLASVAASVTTATPTFVAAIGLLALFSAGLGWFPATGAGDGFADRLWHLTLPAVAMSIAAFGVLARVGNAAFAEELGREHVEVARSRGAGGAAVIRRHVVRNALGPLLTVAGLLVASLFVGSAVVETAFGLDGVGSLLVSSVSRQDFPVVQGIALIAVLLFVTVNTLVDLALPFIDPRVTVGGLGR